MNGKEAIKILRTIQETVYLGNRRFYEAIELAIKALEQPEQRWIPVSRRPPEEGERVLATHLGGLNPKKQVIEHIYQCGKFTRGWDMDMNVDSPTFGQRYMGGIIAWMPMPKPYKEGEE